MSPPMKGNLLPMERRLDELIERKPDLAVCRSQILAAYRLLARCFHAGGRVYLCGNGGSAADAEHIAGELLKGFYSPRRPRAGVLAKLPRDLRRLQDGLPAIPLTGFLSLRTAVGNDIGPDLEFAQLVWVLGRPNDVLIAISTSGQALNVCQAARTARARKMKVLALTGRTGGRLKSLCDACVHSPVAQTHLIQEHHLAIYHSLCLGLEDEFFG